MKKIAIVHYTFLPVIAGVEFFIKDQAILLSNHGFEVKIISGTGKNFHPKIKVDVIPELNSRNSTYLKMRRVFDQGKIPSGFEKEVKKVTKKLKNSLKNIDICIAHQATTMHFNFLLTKALYQLIKENPKIKFISWAHDTTFLDQNYLKKYSKFRNKYPWNLLTKKWSKIKYITISKTRQEQLAKLFKISKNKIKVVSNGIDLISFWQLDKEVKKIFYQEKLYNCDLVGVLPMRIVRRKNIEMALKIIAALKKFVPKIKYIITGALDFQNPDVKEYFFTLKKLRKKLNLEKNVLFLADYKLNKKRIDLEKLKINQLYLLADFLLAPSKIEGFGMPLIEAAAMKTPIICSDIKIFKEIGKNDVFYFNLKENPIKIAKKILKFLEKISSQRIFRRIIKKYDLENIYQEKIKAILNK